MPVAMSSAKANCIENTPVNSMMALAPALRKVLAKESDMLAIRTTNLTLEREPWLKWLAKKSMLAPSIPLESSSHAEAKSDSVGLLGCWIVHLADVIICDVIVLVHLAPPNYYVIVVELRRKHTERHRSVLEVSHVVACLCERILDAC